MSTKENRYTRFVHTILNRVQTDKAYGAKLRRADNPDTAYQSWDILLGLGVDIKKDSEWRAFSLIGAALAKVKANADGTVSLGRALNTGAEDSDALRLRRILACSTQAELCLLLRPLLNYICSQQKGKVSPLCFAKLLQEVLWFGYDEESTNRLKRNWTSEFYKRDRKEDAGVSLPS